MISLRSQAFLAIYVSFVVKGAIIILCMYASVIPPLEILFCIFTCLFSMYSVYSKKKSYMYPGIISEAITLTYAPSRVTGSSAELLKYVTISFDIQKSHHMWLTWAIDLCGFIYVAVGSYFVAVLLKFWVDFFPDEHQLGNRNALIKSDVSSSTLPRCDVSNSTLPRCDVLNNAPYFESHSRLAPSQSHLNINKQFREDAASNKPSDHYYDCYNI